LTHTLRWPAEAERAVGHRASLRIEEELLQDYAAGTPSIRPSGGARNDEQQALYGVLKPHLHMDAIGPEVQ
jgi:hypothetical protein